MPHAQPSNVLLSLSGGGSSGKPTKVVARVADFGLSWGLSETQTCTMRTGGTTRYAAPETLEESPSFSGESDVYSYGMLAYHVASRTVPWQQTQHEVRVMMSILEGKRPSLDALDAGCPPALRDLIERSWQQDRKSRPTFEGIVEVAEVRPSA